MAKKSTNRSGGLKSASFSSKSKSTSTTSGGAKAAAFPMRKKSNPLVLAGGGVALLLIVLLALVLRPKGGTTALAAEISVEQAYQKYQQGAFVLDVRQPEEWDEYHAPNTTLIPLGELSTRLAEVPKDQEIVVVCRSGNRSQEGRDILLDAGYTNVTSMAGGLNAWRTAGYPIEP